MDLSPVWDWFRVLYETTGIKLTIFYDAFDRARFFNGFLTSVRLMGVCLVASVVIGVVGAWIQGSRLRVLRLVTQGYIQFFRNTPPLVQLYFFYFALGSYLKITDAATASRCRSSRTSPGRRSASRSMPARSTSRSSAPASRRCRARRSRPPRASATRRLKAYIYVILPLAFRISLPALNNNLVNLVKTTTIAYAIAVPEMLYVANQIWSDESNVPEMMNVLLIVYVALVGVCWSGYGALGARAAHSGIHAGMIANRTDMAVLKPFRLQRREPWRITVWHGVALLRRAAVAFGIGEAHAQAAAGKPGIIATMIKWTPLLLQGFALNIAMSFLAMAIGTVARRTARPRPDLAAAAGARLAWLVTQILPQRAVAGAAVLLHAAAAVRGAHRAWIDPAAGLAEVDDRPRAARDGERRGNRARRGSLHSLRPVGGGGIARDVAARRRCGW